jgi:hypothetical protein
MVNTDAVNYIKKQLHTGYTPEEIREAMLDAGWKKEDIEKAFYVIGGEAHPVKPQKEGKAPEKRNDKPVEKPK